MQKAASESGRIYGMIFHQRLYPKYIRIKQMIDNGELGDIKRVCLINSRYLRTSYYHKSGSWRSSFAGEGGGALINQGQHILDMYQYLTMERQAHLYYQQAKPATKSDLRL